MTMNRRYQVNIRLERELLNEIDRLAGEEAVDRSEMARRLLGSGLATRRMGRALDEYRAGNVTAWRAAEIAGVSLYEMLERIHEEGVPYELDPAVLVPQQVPGGRPSAVHEEPSSYGLDTAATLSGAWKPTTVRTLFVGESAPVASTPFYAADSSLFRAIRDAFALAFGEADASPGPRFLHAFQDRGCWLVDLVERPLDHVPVGERRVLVKSGVTALAQLAREARPEHVVAVKATVEDDVRRALSLAGSGAELLALPVPVRQWRAVFVRELAAALRRWDDPGSRAASARGARADP